VTAAVAADLAANALASDFLVRFSAAGDDGDGAVDSVVFEDSENDLGTGAVPALIVTYR
jgi:hypothetical protein